MNIFYKAYCRTFQKVLHLALPLLPYREPEIHHNIEDVPEILNKNKVTSVLVVTDKFLSTTDGFHGLVKTIGEAGLKPVLYTNTQANPTIHNVEEAKKIYIDNKCEGLIAYGGGSSMDCAKAVGALIACPKKNLKQLKGLLRVVRKIPPLIAIPTTAGTGSEVTITAVITDSDTKYKYTMNDFTLIPYYAVLDANLTITLPKSLTSTTGMDALTHATEAYIGHSTSKETRRLAKEAVALIFENILTAYENPTNLKARSNMLTASYKAGIAFSKSYVGYVHAIAHSLGGQYNVPHGLANAVIMPYILEAYGKKAWKPLSELAIVAKVASPNDSREVAAKKYIDAIRELNEKMNIPTHFDVIKEEDIPVMSKHAAKEANPLYPVPKEMSAKELAKFYHILRGE